MAMTKEERGAYNRERNARLKAEREADPAKMAEWQARQKAVRAKRNAAIAADPDRVAAEKARPVGVSKQVGLTMFEVTLSGMFTDGALTTMLEDFEPNSVWYATPGWDCGGFDEEQTTTFFFNNEADAVKFKLRWV